MFRGFAKLKKQPCRWSMCTLMCGLALRKICSTSMSFAVLIVPWKKMITKTITEKKHMFLNQKKLCPQKTTTITDLRVSLFLFLPPDLYRSFHLYLFSSLLVCLSLIFLSLFTALSVFPPIFLSCLSLPLVNDNDNDHLFSHLSVGTAVREPWPLPSCASMFASSKKKKSLGVLVLASCDSV